MAAEESPSSKFNVQHLLKDVWKRYIPIKGCVSAMVFSTNIMNPRGFRRVFSPYESLVANALWFNSHLGVGLYIYNRPHLLSAPKYERVMYSVYGAAIFNFGVVLFWATCKTLLPRSIPVRVLFGLGSGAAVFIIGKNYLDFVDKQAVTMETEE